MLTPTIHIVIGSLLFKGCTSFSVTKDVDNLSSTAKIDLPLKVLLNNSRVQVSDILKPGQKLEINAGYKEHEIHSVFKGYVTNLDPGTSSIKVAAEDAVYLLRKQPVLIDEEDTTLAAICSKIVSGTNIKTSSDIMSLGIDAFKYKGNAAGALAKLKESLKLTIYLEDDTLYAGGLQLQLKGNVKATYGRNIYKNNVSYQYADANPVQVTVIGKKEDGEEVKYVAGQEGGSTMTFYKYNITDMAMLKQIANEELARYSFDGFKGSVKLWFIPFAEMSGTVDYENANYPQEVKGRYFIKGVTYSYSTSAGLKQNLTMGAKL